METWHYDTLPDLDQTLTERLRRFPREPDMLVYGLRSAAAVTLRGWLRLYHRLTVEGRDHLPSEGSFVMVANHASHLDALCLVSALPSRKLHRAFPAAAHDYFFISLPRLALATVFINALPFEDECTGHVICQSVLEHVPEPQKALDEIRRVLRPGGTAYLYLPFIFPYHDPSSRHDYYRFSKDDIIYLFRDFTDVRIQPHM